MGGNLQHCSDRGAVECSGKWPAHKYLGINGGECCSENILQKQKQHSCTLNDGQYTSPLLHIKMGGTKNVTLFKTAKDLWDLYLPKEILLTGEYLPGILNKGSNWESRNHNSSSEWRLNPAVFTRFQKLMGPMDVDLFASRVNFQLSQYISWRPDPGAWKTNALQFVLEKDERLRFSSLCPDRQGPCKSAQGQRNFSADHTTVAGTAMVSNTTTVVHSNSNTSSSVIRFVIRPQRPPTSSDNEERASLGGLEGFRQKLSNKGISVQAGSLIEKCRRKGPEPTINRPGESGLVGVVKGRFIHLMPL